VDCLRLYREWSNELAYALKAFSDSSESCAGSDVVDVEDCMEKRLDWEVDGVRTGLEYGAGEDCGRGD
jgi:hypothetical protein